MHRLVRLRSDSSRCRSSRKTDMHVGCPSQILMPLPHAAVDIWITSRSAIELMNAKTSVEIAQTAARRVLDLLGCLLQDLLRVGQDSDNNECVMMRRSTMVIYLASCCRFWSQPGLYDRFGLPWRVVAERSERAFEQQHLQAVQALFRTSQDMTQHCFTSL